MPCAGGVGKSHLFNRLLGQHVIDDPHGVERAVKKAKRYIDVIFG